MTVTAHVVLLIIALVCFLAAAFGANPPRVNLLAGGLAFLALAMLIG